MLEPREDETAIQAIAEAPPAGIGAADAAVCPRPRPAVRLELVLPAEIVLPAGTLPRPAATTPRPARGVLDAAAAVCWTWAGILCTSPDPAVRGSHTFTKPSTPQEITVARSSMQSSPVMAPGWARNLCLAWHRLISQITIDPALSPLTKVFPRYAHSNTGSVCADK